MVEQGNRGTARTARRGAIARATVGLCLAMSAVVAFPAASLGGATKVKATENDTFKPKSVSIAKGSSVKFTNPTNDRHTVTSYKGNWDINESLSAGETFKKKFKKSGTFKYRCTIHSDLDNGDCDGMCGKVNVG